MRPLRRILIIGDASCFTTGLTTWLASEVDFQVSNLTIETEAGYVQAIENIAPDVIILSWGCSIGPERLLELLAPRPDLRGVKLIVIHQTDNGLEVYDHQRIGVYPGEELLAVLRNIEVVSAL